MRYLSWIIGVLAVGLIMVSTAWAEECEACEETITMDELPEAVVNALGETAPGAEIVEIERIVKFEVEVMIDGEEVEFQFAADGTLLRRESDDDDDDNGMMDDDDDDDEGEEEVEISLDELPAAVRAAIEREVPGAEIEEASMETEDDVTTYEVEVELGDEEWELEFAADGTLLERERDDDDHGHHGYSNDDDDDDDHGQMDDDDEAEDGDDN